MQQSTFVDMWPRRDTTIKRTQRKLGERLLRHLERRRKAKSAMSKERMKILMQQSTHSSLDVTINLRGHVAPMRAINTTTNPLVVIQRYAPSRALSNDGESNNQPEHDKLALSFSNKLVGSLETPS
jgi:hypothetical protein